MAEPEGDFAPLEATVNNLLTQSSLKWVFVGGKGGVGKTTTSCSLAVQLAKHRKNVLVVSTDPAHNLSDAFNQKFGREPRLVDGFANLYCMELEAKVDDALLADFTASAEAAGETGLIDSMKSLATELYKSMPGIDEIMGFAEVMKSVQNSEYECVVFDTAPTGHTLRLLGFPEMLKKGVTKLLGLKSKLGGLLGPMSAMMRGPDGADLSTSMFSKLEELQTVVNKAVTLLRDPDHTTFVPVCIPEFLSLYETERLVQELTRFDIDVHNVVVNQVLPVAASEGCTRCQTRQSMQQKYLDQIADLYEDFHVTVTPLLDGEVRGTAALRSFGSYLTTPYEFETPTSAPSVSDSAAGGATGGASSS